MYEVTIFDCNGNTYSENDQPVRFAIPEINANGNASTVRDVVTNDAILNAFGADTSVADDLISIDDSDIVDAFRDAIIDGTRAHDGMELSFNLEFVHHEAEAEVEENNGEAVANTPGRITVYVAGGMRHTDIDIVNGVTTMYECVYNDAVRSLSGMNDTQLSSCAITLNDVEVMPDMLVAKTVKNGDYISMTMRAAHTKG